MPLFITPATSRTGSPFPDAPLDVTFEMAWGADLTAAPRTWTWTDMTGRLLANAVNVTRGVSPGASEASATTGSVVLANDDGHLTPKNRQSPYTITRAVPGRLRVRPHTGDGVDGFDRPPAGDITWGYAETGQVWGWAATLPYTTSTDFALNGTQGIHRVQAANGYRISSLQILDRDVDMYGTVTLDALPTGGAANLGFAARQTDLSNYIQLRAQVLASTGVVTAQILRRVDNVDTTLASIPTVLTVTPGMPIHLHARLDGPDLYLSVWLGADPEPDTWTASATTVLTVNNLGHGLRSGVTSTATVLPDMAWDNVAIVPFSTRLAGHADDWKPTFLPAAGGYTWSQVTVGISGIRRRLARGQAPARSPLRAAAEIYRAAGQPLIAYWPLEDESDSKRALNVVDDRRPMTVGTLPVSFGAYTPPAPTTSSRRWGTAPIADLSDGGRLSGTVQAGTSSPTQFAVRGLFGVYAPGFGADIPIMDIVFTGGPWAKWTLLQFASGVLAVQLWDQVGGHTFSTGVGAATTGLGQYQVDAIQSGADVDLRLWVGTSAGSGYVLTNLPGMTLARVARVVVNPLSVVNSAASNDLGKQWAAGHVQVWDTCDIPIDADSATDPDTGFISRVWQAWAGENAHRRLARLCAAEGVPMTVTTLTDAALATPMGAQPDAPLLDLLGECARTDGGLLFEGAFDLAYLPRGERYNRDPGLTVDLATYRVGSGEQEQVLLPVYDDQGLINDATVSRTGGSSARYEDLDHIEENGRYSDSREINALDDEQPPAHAAWDVRVGTVEDLRYPDLNLDLAANPDLIGQWLGCDVGSRITRTNPPEPATSGEPIEQVLYGYTETLAPTEWSVKANCAPYEPWQIAVVDDGTTGAVESTAAYVSVPAGAASTSIQVTDTFLPWTTDPADMPIDVLAETGEQLRVTAIAGTSSPQTWTVVRAVNGISGFLPALTTIRLVTPAIPGL